MAKSKKVEDAVEEISPPKNHQPAKKPSMYTAGKDLNSDEKFNRTGSAESGNPKNRGKKTKGQTSDDKVSRESNSHDSERGRRII